MSKKLNGYRSTNIHIHNVPVKMLKNKDNVIVLGRSYRVLSNKKNGYGERIIRAEAFGTNKSVVTVIVNKDATCMVNRRKSKHIKIAKNKL